MPLFYVIFIITLKREAQIKRDQNIAFAREQTYRKICRLSNVDALQIAIMDYFSKRFGKQIINTNGRMFFFHIIFVCRL